MKKLAFVLITLFTTTVSFSQSIYEIATTLSVDVMKDNLREDNKFVFIVTDQVSEGDVIANAQNFTNYFTVDFNVDERRITLNLRNGDIRDRIQIQRFITSFNLRYVSTDNEIMALEDFSDRHLEY